MTSDRPFVQRQNFGLARVVSIAVGAGLMFYGMRRRSWLGRLLVSAGAGLMAKSIGSEGALASIFQRLQGAAVQSDPKLPSSS